MLYIGIDGGLKGGIAMLDSTPGSKPFALSPVPLQAVGKREELDVLKLWETVGMGLLKETTFIIEECSYHQPSHAAMRSQALSYGKLTSLLEIKGMRFIAVQAQKWQKDLLGKLPAGTTKEAALGLARRLWPSETFIPEGCRKVSDGLVDAALLCEYARRNNL